MTFKNLVLATAALGLGCGAHASVISSGFYVGMGGGMERMNGQRSERMDTDPTAFEAQVFTNKQDMKKHGHLLNLFGGYLYKWNCFAIAGEAFYEFGRIEDKITRTWVDSPGVLDFKGNYSASLEKKNSFGFRINIGGILKDRFFAYALLGLSASQLRYSTTASLLDPTAPAAYKQEFEASRKLAYGFDYGLGLQYQVNQWRLGVEGYIRNIKSQTLSFKFNDPHLHPQPVFHATFKPLMTVVTVKFSLTF